MSRVPVFKTTLKLKNRIDSYKQFCIDNVRVPSISGLAVYCEVGKKTLYNYMEKPEFREVLERFKTFCEDFCVNEALYGKIDPGMTKFILKNNYGYKDRVDVDQTQTIVINSNIPKKEIE
jgi:hypothetical protein